MTRLATPRLAIPLLSVLLLVCVVGCHRPEPSPRSAIEVTDDLGRRVHLDRPALRVLSLAPSNTEIVFALGASNLLVGRTDACTYPSAAAKIRSVGGLFPPSMERILAAAPDLVLMIDGHTKLRSSLEARGIPVMVLQPHTLKQALSGFERVGLLLGAEPAAKRLVAGLNARLHALSAPPVRPRVLVEIWDSPLTVAGPSSFIDDVIHQAGGRNAVSEGGPWPKLSVERLLLTNPDVVITSKPKSRGRILAGERPGWGALSAVKTRRVFAPADPDLIARPGPRIVDGVEWLARELRR